MPKPLKIMPLKKTPYRGSRRGGGYRSPPVDQADIPETLIFTDTEYGIHEIINYLTDKEFVAYDTETTGLQRDAQVIGFSVAAELDRGYYVIMARWNKEAQRLDWVSDDVRKAATELIQVLTKKQLIMHNATVDVNWTRVNFGVDLLPALHTDTLILAHVTDENRASYGLKELAYSAFGMTAKKEQEEMQASVIANGGVWETKRGGNKEMYKADTDIMAKYGAKDTILTLKLFYKYVPELFEQKLEKFFYDDESMPLARTGTYDLNTRGLRINVPKLQQLAKELEIECARLEQEVLFDVQTYVKDKYPGTKDSNKYNMGSSQQLSWLLFFRLGNDWKKVTKGGREVAKLLIGKAPYSPGARRDFISAIEMRRQEFLSMADNEPDKKKKAALISQSNKWVPWKYVQCDKKALMNFAVKYSWVAKILEHRKASKLLKSYALGMQRFIRYGTIYPSFKQHGTTSGRYSSSQPNFQNLPRDDKRVKSCIEARPGRVFVGADYSQLEPRTFTSQSQDPILMDGFKKGEDFYGVIGIPVFNLYQCSANKKAKNYIGSDEFHGGKYKYYRQVAKVIALSLAYGTTPYKLSDELRDEEGKNLSVERCTEIRDGYFEKYKGVAELVRKCHEQVVNTGVVFNQYGRPRRIPEAMELKKLGFPKTCDVSDLQYQQRSLLNLAVNHTVQSTAASIVNRAAIEFARRMKEMNIDAYIVLQVHDELVAECLEKDAELVAQVLKEVMEQTTLLKGVDLIAEPKIGRTLADLK